MGQANLVDRVSIDVAVRPRRNARATPANSQAWDAVMRHFCGERRPGRGVQAINFGANAMASDTPMGKQGDEFEPAPGLRGWWIIYADIFFMTEIAGTSSSLRWTQLRGAGDFRPKNLLNSFTWTLDCFFSTIKSVPLLSKSKTCRPSGRLSVCCIPSRFPCTAPCE